MAGARKVNDVTNRVNYCEWDGGRNQTCFVKMWIRSKVKKECPPLRLF